MLMDGFVYYTFTALTAFLVTLVLLGVFEPLARWLARLPLWAELLIGLSLPFLGALLMLVGFSFFPDHQEPQQTPTAAGSDSWLRSLAAVREALPWHSYCSWGVGFPEARSLRCF